MEIPELTRRFQEHVLADVDYLKTRGYNPTHFLGMIAQRGGAVAVAKYVIFPRRDFEFRVKLRRV